MQKVHLVTAPRFPPCFSGATGTDHWLEKNCLSRLICPMEPCAMQSHLCNRLSGANGSILMNQSFYHQAVTPIPNN